MKCDAYECVVSRNCPIDKVRRHRAAIDRDAQSPVAQRLLMARNGFAVQLGDAKLARQVMYIFALGEFPQATKQAIGNAPCQDNLIAFSEP